MDFKDLLGPVKLVGFKVELPASDMGESLGLIEKVGIALQGGGGFHPVGDVLHGSYVADDPALGIPFHVGLAFQLLWGRAVRQCAESNPRRWGAQLGLLQVRPHRRSVGRVNQGEEALHAIRRFCQFRVVEDLEHLARPDGFSRPGIVFPASDIGMLLGLLQPDAVGLEVLYRFFLLSDVTYDRG